MKREELIAIKIVMIQEEYSDSDIQKAIELLDNAGNSITLTKYLKDRLNLTSRRKRKITDNARNTKPSTEQQSRSVIELKGVDDEKYALLLEFDRLIRRNEVLNSIEEIRRLGERLDKHFVASRTRGEAISRLMAILVVHPIDEIRDIIKSSITSSSSRNSEYRDLAQFIIEGRPSKQ